MSAGKNTGNPAGAVVVTRPNDPYTRAAFMSDLKKVAKKSGPKK